MKNMINLSKKISCVFLSLVLLASCFGCTGKGSSSVTVADNAEPVLISSDNFNSHSSSQENFKDIAASGLITLLFDETSSAIGVRINNGEDNNSIWSALPVADAAAQSGEAEIVSLEIIHNESRYILNSQDNSVAVNCAYWESVTNGFRVIYFITDSPEKIANIGIGAADEVYSSAAADSILYKVEVNYELRDGCLYADLVWKNLGNKKDVLVNIGFLEYFGAVQTAQEGDFILVPDGSGALIDTFSSSAFEPISIPVYGNDFAGVDEMSAVVPAFGMKTGNAAFAAVIEHGDAVASVTAGKADNGSEFNRVGTVFSITPSQVNEGQRIYSEITYTGKIGLSYRFLNGSDATYASLAAACREQLVRNFTLSTGSIADSEHLPVLINVIGRADSGEFFSLPKNLTTFDEAQDLLNRIKSKGVNNVYLRYSGALSGGLDAQNISRADIISTLGGKSGLRELNDYAATLNFNIFVDVALMSDCNAGGKTVGDLVSSGAFFSYDNILKSTGFVEPSSKRYAVRINTFENNVLSALEKFDSFDATGFCVSDAGQYLYSDYSSMSDRQTVRNIVAEKLVPLATQNLVMVEKGNFYSLKNADVVADLPVKTVRAEDDSYTSVPFVQIILHGIVEYSGAYINTSDNKDIAFLKCIEYGMLPGFVLTNDSFAGTDKYTEIFNSDNWLNNIYSSYSSFSLLMSDLRSSRITDHYMVSEGVYCTEYESTTRIYVNYTDEPITVSGITVEPMNYFRVN